jgi:hypothetical protein
MKKFLLLFILSPIAALGFDISGYTNTDSDSDLDWTKSINLNGTQIQGSQNVDPTTNTTTKTLNFGETQIQGTSNTDPVTNTTTKTLNIEGTQIQGTRDANLNKTLNIETTNSTGQTTNTIQIEKQPGAGQNTNTINVNGNEIRATYDADSRGFTNTLRVSTNTDNSVLIQGQDGSLRISSVENGNTNSVRIEGTPTRLSIIANNPETKNFVSNSAVIRMEGDAPLLIADNDDLQTYLDLVVKKESRVNNIEIRQNEVEVSYKQQARFLGIFNSSLNSKIIVNNSNNNVEVKLPWYSFLFTKENKIDANRLGVNISSGLTGNAVSINSNESGTGVNIQARKSAKTVGLIIGEL